MNFKRSIYTVQAKLPDGSLALLNTLTGAIVRIPSQHVDSTVKILRGKEISNDHEAIVDGLRKGGFIVDECRDEYRVFSAIANSVKYRTDEFELILMPTEQCNFRCVYCYESFIQPQMSERVKESVKKLFGKRLPYLRVFRSQWFGGEPLLSSDLIIELSDYFLKQCESKSVKYESIMTTNGYYLDQSTAQRLFQCGIRTFQITVDGLRETHNKKRVLYGSNKGTYDIIVQNLLAMKDMNEDFRVFLRCNIDNDNIDLVQDFLGIFKKSFGMDNRFMVFARPVWAAEGNQNSTLCDQQTRDHLFIDFGAEAAVRGLRWYDGLKGHEFAGEVCYAAKPNSYVIGSDGTVYKCTSAFELDLNRVGKLDDEGNLNLNMEKYSRWIENFHARESKCHSCHILPLCQGSSCPLNTIIDKASVIYCPPGKRGIKKKLLIVASSNEPQPARSEA